MLARRDVPAPPPASGLLIEATALAVVLALGAAVPVAWLLQGAPHGEWVIQGAGWHPLGSTQALVLALGSVLPAAVLGGLAGGVTWARRPTLAPVIALTVAWATGVVALPVAAAALDVPLRAGIVCVPGCSAALRDDGVPGGLRAYAESLLAGVFFFYVLVVPAIVLLVARRTRRTILWVIGLLATHAALHLGSILMTGSWAIYAVLVGGLLIWSAWLWARERIDLFRGGPTRWGIVLVPAVAMVAGAAAVSAQSWVPPVPLELSRSALGTVTVDGRPEPLPTATPAGQAYGPPGGSGCLDPLVDTAGRLELCWEATRNLAERFPGGDEYLLRAVATWHSTGPASWVAIDIALQASHEFDTISDIWPEAVVDGPCRVVTVEGLHASVGQASEAIAADDAVCGRTTSYRLLGWGVQRVIWTCAGCGADSPDGREIVVRQLVKVEPGSVPTWTVSAAVGMPGTPP